VIEVIVGGIILVHFAGRVVAILDERGRVVWKELLFPLDTVEFIINRSRHETYIWN
jgi:hypothetical protein